MVPRMKSFKITRLYCAIKVLTAQFWASVGQVSPTKMAEWWRTEKVVLTE